MKLGTLSLAILENFVESKLGDKFIKELLRHNYDLVATITSSLESTEIRFI